MGGTHDIWKEAVMTSKNKNKNFSPLDSSDSKV